VPSYLCMKSSQEPKAGFTLIELLVVIAIIAILA
jgi:prepilin-type N-terminal cleavage/methylation domain-containing protein